MQSKSSADLKRFREQARRTFRSMSDQALSRQATVVVGGVSLEELNRELSRRGMPASAGAAWTGPGHFRRGF